MDILHLIDNAASDTHSRNVALISEMMARKAGYSDAESRIIAQAALFHDAGKIEIPGHILNKPSALTPDEYDIVKTHTTAGYKRLNKAAQILALASVASLQHHEHADGHGYPDSIAGSETHPYSKLIACADVADALFSHRTYKNPWNINIIRAYFTEQSGKQFDPAMVRVLFSIMDKVQALYQK
jgi:HD-GYP domain-containing protein (c-di-GMP phosphodiesterase class II)